MKHWVLCDFAEVVAMTKRVVHRPAKREILHTMTVGYRILMDAGAGHYLEQKVQFLAKAHLLQTAIDEMLLLEIKVE